MSAPETAAPPIEEFAVEATAFLDAHAARRTAGDVEWGQGPDRIGLMGDGVDPDVAMAAAKEWQATKFASGFGWLTGPRDLGGRELPLAHDMLYQSLEGEYELPQGSLSVGLGMVLPTIARWGTPAVRARYAAGLAGAELVGCQLFSEPGAGSDLAAISTAAVRDGDEWIVDGQKVWTSTARHADVGLLLARTDPAGSRHNNLTAFVLDMHAPGIEVRPIRQINGGAEFNEVFLTGVRIPDEHRLGPVDEGWRVAISTLMSERSSITSGRSGGIVDLDRLFALVRHRAADDAAVRRLAVQAYITQWLLRQVGRRTAEMLLGGGEPGPLFSIGKILIAENLREVAACASAALGPSIVADTGEWGTYSWSTVPLSIWAYSVGGGSDEIQRNILAERCLGLPRDARPA
jgi:alkylation response protein AidB-like acyl-CoA dehydrogenase